jgi:phage terminase large subunit-like protein
MSDDQTIDGNAIFKHIKKMYSEKEYRQRYQRLDYMKRSEKQIEAFNAPFRFLSVRAGNRSGKSEYAMMYSGCALLDRWPSDYTGYKFVRPNIVRSVSFNEWIIGPDGTTVRDVQQAKLLGGLTQDELGTGWLPLDALRHPITLSRGVSGLADKVLVTRDDGTLANLKFLTSQQDRQSFQGDAVDLIILDEDPGKRGEEIFPELIARTVGTGGRIIHTATPLAGITPIRQFFREGGKADRGEIRISIYQNPFLTPEDIRIAEASYSERERATRLMGDDLPGYGAVFNFEESSYLHDMRPEDVPDYWPWINAVDFSHNGLSSQAHPFAFVSCAVDPTTKTLYVMHALRIKQQLPPVHVQAIKQWPAWDAVTAWGADGHQRDSSGASFYQNYKSLGLPMRSTHAVLPKTGGVNLEAQFALLEQMFSKGQLKIARHLVDLREELRDLHYDKNGDYVPEADDLASALRYAAMDMKYARTLPSPDNPNPRKNEPTMAKGIDDWDIFTGKPDAPSGERELVSVWDKRSRKGSDMCIGLDIDPWSGR